MVRHARLADMANTPEFFSPGRISGLIVGVSHRESGRGLIESFMIYGQANVLKELNSASSSNASCKAAQTSVTNAVTAPTMAERFGGGNRAKGGRGVRPLHNRTHAGLEYVPGLLEVARHSGFRSGEASARARRTPSELKSFA